MKIAVFTDSYRPYVSGVVRSIDTFGAELLEMGHKVYVFGPRYYGNSGSERKSAPADWTSRLGGRGRKGESPGDGRAGTDPGREASAEGRGGADPGREASAEDPGGSDDGSPWAGGDGWIGAEFATEPIYGVRGMRAPIAASREDGFPREGDPRDGKALFDEDLYLPDGRPAANKVYRFWSIPVPMYRGFTAPVPISVQADELLEELGIDIIHSHTPFAMGTLGAVLAKKRRLPLVFTHHTMYHEYVHYLPGVRSVLRQMMLRYVGTYSRRADLVIAPTPQIRQFIVSEYDLPDDSVVAIPTGIDMDDFARGDGASIRRQLGIPSADKVLVFVGRLGMEKNVEFLLQALASIHRKRDDVHLVLVGDGPERQHLAAAAEKLGIAGRLHLTGTLTKAQVSDAFHGSDLFVIASQSETQGLATLEAMAAGLPVVGVEAPGTADMVEQGRQGVLTAPDVGAFSGAVLQLLGDSEAYARCAEAARKRAETFTAANMARRLVDVYSDVLQGGRSGVGRDSAVAME